MADISSSAAKQHVLSGAGDEVSRMSGDAVQVARDLGHQFFSKLGGAAAQEASKAKRKTIMPADLHNAARSLCSDGGGSSEGDSFGESAAEGQN